MSKLMTDFLNYFRYILTIFRKCILATSFQNGHLFIVFQGKVFKWVCEHTPSVQLVEAPAELKHADALTPTIVFRHSITTEQVHSYNICIQASYQEEWGLGYQLDMGIGWHCQLLYHVTRTFSLLLALDLLHHSFSVRTGHSMHGVYLHRVKSWTSISHWGCSADIMVPLEMWFYNIDEAFKHCHSIGDYLSTPLVS
jgi:hypothetical protein